LWLLPVLAFVISLIALHKIKTSDRQLTGQYVALLGLLLAVFFGVAGPAHTISRRYYLETRAARFGEKFMQLLQQNQPLVAFQLTRPAATRKPLAADEADPFPKDEKAKKAYQEFLQLSPVKSLRQAGSQTKFELLSSTFFAGNESRDDVALQFRILAPAGGDAKTTATTTLMYVERMLAYGSHTEQWQIIPPALRTE
jgi:hypothetical protein